MGEREVGGFWGALGSDIRQFEHAADSELSHTTRIILDKKGSHCRISGFKGRLVSFGETYKAVNLPFSETPISS